MPTPTIKQPNKHFTPTLYEGNGTAIGSGGKTITGLEFKPDFVWIKNRDAADSHSLYDSSRGATKQLESDTNAAETTESEGVTSFTSDGFTLGSLNQVNTNNESYVGWNWKANAGTTATNDDGSITSTTQVNSDAGFSIVRYTGNRSSGATIGHGLSQAPEFIITKNLDATYNWIIYFKGEGANRYGYLNLTNAWVTDTTGFNNVEPTNSVFTVGSAYESNGTHNMIAYCWHGVEGFSKFGSYKGNGNADGAFIYLGFKPACVIIKSSSNSTDWVIYDNKRSPLNTGSSSNTLYPNLSSAKASAGGLDFLSNGFKLRSTNGYNNGSGRTYVYMAFAELPFFDDQSPVTAR